jgi:hypothetical protein
MFRNGSRNVLLFRGKFLKQKEYWIKKLSGEYDATGILFGYDKSPPPVKKRARIEIAIPDELGSRVIKLCKGSDLSIYILLLSALKTLIFHYTSIEDIVVLSPVSP